MFDPKTDTVTEASHASYAVESQSITAEDICYMMDRVVELEVSPKGHSLLTRI